MSFAPRDQKRMWVADVILRRAAALIPFQLPGPLLGHPNSIDVPSAHEQNVKHLDILESAGRRRDLRGGFWRDLMRVAEALELADRTSSLRADYTAALQRAGTPGVGRSLAAENASLLLASSVQVSVDYHQFYVWDAGVDPEAPQDYSDLDVHRMVKVAPNVVVVQPVRNMTVPVTLELHTEDPGFDVSDWQHIVECALEVPTGRLQLHECTGSAVLDLAVPPGTYRVRVLFAGLDTVSEDGLEGNDRYAVVLWSATNQPLLVRRQWESAG